MGFGWTDAHAEAAKEIAKQIKAAHDAGNKADEERAWRSYNNLHNVQFALIRFGGAHEMVDEPIMLVAENDADAVLARLGEGNPPAAEAVLIPLERRDEILRKWSWNPATKAWDRK